VPKVFKDLTLIVPCKLKYLGSNCRENPGDRASLSGTNCPYSGDTTYWRCKIIWKKYVSIFNL